MSTFVPSQYSHAKSYSGITADLAEQVEKALSALGITGGSDAAGESSGKSATTSSGKSWDLASGNYLGPGGWVYNYNDRTKKVKIVVAPAGHSGAGTTYSRGDSVYEAIVKELIAKGEPLTSTKTKALKTAAGSSAPSAFSRAKEAFVPSAGGQAEAAAASGGEIPFYKQSWFPPVTVFGGLLIIGIVVIATTGKKKMPPKGGKVIPFPVAA